MFLGLPDPNTIESERCALDAYERKFPCEHAGNERCQKNQHQSGLQRIRVQKSTDRALHEPVFFCSWEERCTVLRLAGRNYKKAHRIARKDTERKRGERALNWQKKGKYCGILHPPHVPFKPSLLMKKQIPISLSDGDFSGPLTDTSPFQLLATTLYLQPHYTRSVRTSVQDSVLCINLQPRNQTIVQLFTELTPALPSIVAHQHSASRACKKLP